MDIEKITKASGCYYDDCLLKIDYLKNKRIIGDLYIDTKNGIINDWSEEDEELLKKYQGFIYGNHSQIKEIATKMPGAEIKNIDAVEEKVFQDLCYLDDKHLLNVISINRVNRKIHHWKA